MAEISVDVDVDLQCYACGRVLDATKNKKNKGILDVFPCQGCLDAAKNEGREEGNA